MLKESENIINHKFIKHYAIIQNVQCNLLITKFGDILFI